MEASREEVDKRLADLIRELTPHQKDPAALRALLEAEWLRGELAEGRLVLPVRSTQELYLPYAVTEGYLDDLPPSAKAAADQVLDALLD